MEKLFVIILFLAACAPHATLKTAPNLVEGTSVVPVFTVSNRAFDLVETPSGRSDQLKFARLDIAVPPERSPGEITLAGNTPNPETDFLLADSQAFSKAGFRKALSASLRQLPRDERDVLLYVHGFNNSFADGVFRMAQLTHDVKLKGVSVHFSWPSYGHPLAYARDRDSAIFSRDALVEVLELIDVPEARRVGVIAHSMGAFLTMEALRQMDIGRPGSVARTLDGVLLISPDIDVEVFRSQARRIKPLPKPFAIFLSQRDRALNLSARLTGERARLGNMSDSSRIGEFDVVVVDISEFSSGEGHFDAGTSPALIGILAQAADVDNAFASDASGVSGLLPGSVLTIQNVTQFVLSPPGQLPR